MFPTVVLIPAYGRSYSTKKAVLADWLAGKDFKIEAGPYTSIRDLDALREEYIQIAFKYGKTLDKHFYLIDGE